MWRERCPATSTAQPLAWRGRLYLCFACALTPNTLGAARFGSSTALPGPLPTGATLGCGCDYKGKATKPTQSVLLGVVPEIPHIQSIGTVRLYVAVSLSL